jgi:predicted transcriptional regulator
MKSLSLKLQDDIFQATEKMVETLKKPRNTYLNEAIAYYNKYQRRLWLEKQFAIDIALAGEDSAEMARSLENLDPHLID